MGRYGMAGDHYRQSGYVTLQDVPDPNRVYVESFKNLAGGINKFDLPYHLKGNESPFMQNLSWHNGTLTSRLGQVEKYDLNMSDATVVAVSPFTYHGWMICHVVGTYDPTDGPEGAWGFWCVKVSQEGREHEQPIGSRTFVYIARPAYPWESVAPKPISEDPGDFVRYREDVFYKTHGYYHRIKWTNTSPNYDSLSVADITEEGIAFVPTIMISGVPGPSGPGGVQNQQINRLSPWRKVEYNGQTGEAEYRLPETNIQFSQDYPDWIPIEVYVDGEDRSNSVTVDAAAGIVRFIVTEDIPQTGSKVVIKYHKEDLAAYNSILNSTSAIAFGGAQELCMVIGGTDAQPNAYFWSGLGYGDAMDPTYFPMNQYNLAGENSDPITTFGKQQNMLVVFQPNATGRAVFGMEQIDGRETITMNYTRINAEIGCDLPGSLQLIDNNLVWCNRRYGVCRLKDSSAAYENNITVISRKINGDYRVSGLLNELAEVADDAVRSADTGKRYILVLRDQDGKAYEWNYEVSNQDNPSWFYHTNILGVGFVSLPNDVLYEVTADGKVATFEPVFSDFGDTAIEKIYDSPPRDFNSYDRVKNVKSMLFTTRGDSAARTQITYTCDYGSRVDATDLVVVPPAGATQGPYPKVFRRTPGYHNIHHLAFRLYNNTAGKDLNLISAEIYYEYRGRTR